MQRSRKDDALDPRDVERLIAKGQHVIIVDQMVLRCDAWLEYHPGGIKAIEHMVGRDATDEVNA
jgi:delta8-fatty-acid desaturase